MYIIGELRDPQMVQLMILELRLQGIEAASVYDDKQDIYALTLLSDERLAEAEEYYRVKLGFKKAHTVDAEWVKIKSLPRGQTTFALVMICVAIYLFSFLNFGNSLYQMFCIGQVESSFLYEVKRGQFWRLVTPIFLHLSFMHILFNMLWFKDLGYLMEKVFGRTYLLWFILITGVFSNLTQYIVSGPQFGGMSGVLYAMLGFIWVYKKLNDDFEYSLPKFDIGMMIGWFFLCMTGVLGPIANSAHGGGIVAGILAAVLMNFKLDKKHLQFLAIALFFLIFTLVVEGYKRDGRFFLLLTLQ